MRRPVRARVHPAKAGTYLRTYRGRLRTVIVAIGALLVLGIASGTAIARTSATRLESGIVVIKTTLGYQGAAAAGTGMVLTSSGEVLTNNHVIRGATTIKIVVPNTGRTYAARVVGYDVADDVAVLQAAGASNMNTVTTSSSKVTIGAAVTAIGNAGGTGRLTSATGAITRLGDSVVVNDDQGGAVRLTGMIGVNASVVPGDSGGPLMNTSGEVIGMDTAGSAGATFRSTSATQAYAIPITRALSIAKKVVAGSGSTRVHIGETAFMGVQIAGGFGGDRSPGAAIAGVTPGGPAAAAGLAPGDVVTAVNGYHISSPTSLTSSLLTKKPGDSVTITYSDQSGASNAVKLTLASGPAQ
jgi:S1-C subfamily serine protease